MKISVSLSPPENAKDNAKDYEDPPKDYQHQREPVEAKVTSLEVFFMIKLLFNVSVQGNVTFIVFFRLCSDTFSMISFLVSHPDLVDESSS